MYPEPSPKSAQDLNDGEIVARVIAGERELFAVLMRRYNQQLFRIVRAIVRPDEEAEDALQDAYVSAFSYLHTFEGRANFSTWMGRIAIRSAGARRAREVRSARIREQLVSDGRTNMPEDRRDAPENLSVREVQAAVERAIDALPEQARVVVVMRLVEDLSTAETAACLNISEESVRARLHRGRQKLRNLLEPQFAGELARAFAFAGERCDRIVAKVLQRIVEN